MQTEKTDVAKAVKSRRWNCFKNLKKKA